MPWFSSSRNWVHWSSSHWQPEPSFQAMDHERRVVFGIGLVRNAV